MRTRLILCITGIASGMASAADLSLSYAPVWPDTDSFGSRYSVIRVFVTNEGKDTVGTLKIEGASRSALYPIELPKGANKVVDLYSSGQRGYGQDSIVLETGAGNVSINLNPPSGMQQNRRVIGVVSSTEGLLSVVRAKSGGKTELIDSTTKPESAPTRSIGYERLDVLFLGDGAERLSDDAVAAIKRWVLSGGTVVFPGGASAPWLRDARWADVLPIVPGAVKNVGPSRSITALAGIPMASGFSVTEARPKPNASSWVSEDGVELVDQCSYGLGRSVFLAFDPYSAPFSTWKGKRRLVETLALTTPSVDAYLGRPDERDIGRFGPAPRGGSSDPFQAELPAWWKIVGLLFTFLAMAVPVNFLVLSRMKKKELAWITLPVTSLVFSGMIFGTASGLYSSNMARSTQGVLIVQDGSSESVFVGRQKLFVPKGGRYDMGFQGVETATSPQSRGMFGDSPVDPTKDAGLLDIGQVVAPMVEVPNLAFREYDIVQTVTLGGGIGFPHKTTVSDKSVTVDGVLHNNTGHELKAAMIWLGDASLEVGDVAAGASKPVKGTVSRSARPNWNSGTAPPLAGQVALEARVPTLPVGSTLGKVDPQHDFTRLLYVWGKRR